MNKIDVKLEEHLAKAVNETIQLLFYGKVMSMIGYKKLKCLVLQ
jgi:hypothetical protein